MSETYGSRSHSIELKHALQSALSSSQLETSHGRLLLIQSHVLFGDSESRAAHGWTLQSCGNVAVLILRLEVARGGLAGG